MASKAFHVLAFAGLTLALAPQALRAQYRTPEWKNFQNATYVGVESEEARVALFRADEHLSAGRTEEAARTLLGLLHGEARGLVRFGDRLVLPLERAVALKLSAMPAEILVALRAEEEGLAERLLGRRERSARESVLQARRHPLSARAEQRIYAAGQEALLAGEFGAAAAYLEELVHFPSAGPGSTRLLASARLLECLGHLGERPGTEAPMTWPTGMLRSADGAEFDLELRRQALEARAPERTASWETLLGHSSRSRLPIPATGPLVPLFSFESGVHRTDWPEQAPHRRRFEVLGGPFPIPPLPAGLPLVSRGRLFYLDDEQLFAKDLATGKDLFPALRFDFDLHLSPVHFTVVLDRCSMAIFDDMLYLTVEIEARRGPEEARYSVLYGIDLSRQGLVQFRVPTVGRSTDDPLAGLVFSGPPHLESGRLVIPASRLEVKETSCYLLSLDPTEGSLQDSLFLAKAGAVARVSERFSAEESRLVLPAPLAVRRGVAYVCTNLGVVTAVQVAPHELLWSFRYNRLAPTDARRFHRENMFVTGGWPSRAPIALAERLLVSPEDSRYLYSLARWPSSEGDLILHDPVEKESHLAWIGANEDELYFLVRRWRDQAHQSVQATDHHGGIRWETPPLPGDEPVVGVPAMGRRFLYLPTDRRIYRIDLSATGFSDMVTMPPDSVGVPIPRFGALGDLVVTDEYLISQSSRFVHVYRFSETR